MLGVYMVYPVAGAAQTPASSWHDDILCRAIKRAQIPAVKEPMSLLQQDGKWPDGMGCNSSGHLCRVAHKPYSQGSRSSGQQSIGQQDSQIRSSVCLTHFCPQSRWQAHGGQSAIELIQEIGKRITTVTEDTRETVFLFQRLSIALQKGNAIAFQSTFETE